MADIRILPMPNGTVTPQLLDHEHYESFQTALCRLLSTDIAKETIAQLMDGLPLYSVLQNTAGANNLSGAPIRLHKELCEDSAERAEEFISSFDVNLLQFNASLLQAFQHAKPGSDTFLYRLLELLARSIHCIAVSIELTTAKCHAGDIEAARTYHEPPMMVPVGRNMRAYPSLPPHGSLFFHRKYKNHEQYLFGTADMAGYWAEDRIFGGVVLFDRGESGTETRSLWLHSGRKGWTKRIWKPLDWQLQSMAQFFTNGSPEAIAAESEKRAKELPSNVLEELNERWRMIFPYFCDIDNLARHDDYDAIAYHNIYRDAGERQLPATKPQACTQNTFDYPELQPLVEAVMFYPVPDTVPTIEDLNYPRILNHERQNTTVEADRGTQTPSKGAEDSAHLPENEFQADSDAFHCQNSSSNSGSPPASSVWDSPGRKPPSQQHRSDGSQNTQYSESVIGFFENGAFRYADPNFDIDKQIEEVAQGWRRNEKSKHKEDGQQNHQPESNGAGVGPS